MTASATSTGIYVYGVVRAEELPAVSAEGVAGTSVELLEHDGLAALVSRLPPGSLRVKRRDLHRHLEVLGEAFAEATIVPCPFGTVLISEAEVETALLSERYDELQDALARLDGMVQLNIKAVYDEEALLREVVKDNADVARLREATDGLGDAAYYERLRLGELVADLVNVRREADARRLLGRLAKTADDAVVEPGGEYVALKASFLVNRKRLGRFDETLEELARDEQPVLSLEVIGPLPPTAFAAAAASG